MKMADLLDMLDRTLALGDSLDNRGDGVWDLTNGEITTRDACKTELGLFLLYIADGCSEMNKLQAALLNGILGNGDAELSASGLKQMASKVDKPNLNKMLSFIAFHLADSAYSERHGEECNNLTEHLLFVFKTFGELMAKLNERGDAFNRYSSLIDEFHLRVSLDAEDTDDSFENDDDFDDDFNIDDDVLIGYNGTDTDVMIPSGITRIDDHAFSNNDNIESVAIPESVISIGDSAFSYCSSLERVDIPEGVITIEDDAFNSCDSLTDIEIPSTVTSIGADAFCFCNNIKRIKLPITLTDIGNDAFMYCGGLETVVVYGSRRDDDALDDIKENLPEEVTVVWEDDTKGKPEPSSSSKRSSSKEKKQASSSGKRSNTTSSAVNSQGRHMERYNSTIEFDLSSDYQMIWKEDSEDGSRTCSIVSGEYTNGNGETAYEFSATIIEPNITDTEDDIIPAGECPFDTIHRRNPERKYISISQNPQTELHVQEQPVNVLGRIFKAYWLALLTEATGQKLTFIMCSLQWDDEDADKNISSYQHLLEVIKAVRINGKALPEVGFTAEQLVDRLKPDFDGKANMITAKIGLQIQVGDTVFSESTLSAEDEDHIQIETKDGLPLAFPQVDDVFHEHFTIVESGSYTTRRDADFVGQPIRELMEKAGSASEEAYEFMTIAGDDYSLDKKALELATVFRLDEDQFDPYTDTEALIRRGMFVDARMFHALRSLGWTVTCKSIQEHREINTYTFEELKAIGDFIKEAGYLNYSTESHCWSLCSHYDWHVFYVPDAYLDSACEKHTDLRPLCDKENRSGNPSSFMARSLEELRSMDQINHMISRNEETLTSLEEFREDLIDLLPVMQTIYDGFMDDRDRSEKVEGPLADALTAWCALAVAAKEPFYSEEANDSPEANAGLDGPLERPTDDAGQTIAYGQSGKAMTPDMPKEPKRPMPQGEVLNLNGATVISPKQFQGNMEWRNIVIPEGVTEIGEFAFCSCMALETVALPKTLKKIGKNAFMSCRNLRQVEMPEGVEEICNFAFGATNNLKNVYLPDSLQRVEHYIFGFGGDSPYATAHMSGELARRLQINSDDPRHLSAICARRYVIDGASYENMYDYDPASLTEDKILQLKFEKYRSKKEAACHEGKSLQEMIEATRKAVGTGDFEQIIKNLDTNATVSFAGKHFVLSGFGEYESHVKAEIEKRGGIVHSTMVKMANYLVVCIESSNLYHVNKALEWRAKGAANLIVSDYQMWQAIFGKHPAASDTEPQKAAATAVPTKGTPIKESAEPKKAASPTAPEAAHVSKMAQAAEQRESVNKAPKAQAKKRSKARKPSSASVPHGKNASIQTNSSTPVNPNAKRIKQLEKTIASLQREAADIHGLFGFLKKNKIKKQISELEQELYSLKRSK